MNVVAFLAFGYLCCSTHICHRDLDFSFYATLYHQWPSGFLIQETEKVLSCLELAEFPCHNFLCTCSHTDLFINNFVLFLPQNSGNEYDKVCAKKVPHYCMWTTSKAQLASWLAGGKTDVLSLEKIDIFRL